MPVPNPARISKLIKYNQSLYKKENERHNKVLEGLDHARAQLQGMCRHPESARKVYYCAAGGSSDVECTVCGKWVR